MNNEIIISEKILSEKILSEKILSEKILNDEKWDEVIINEVIEVEKINKQFEKYYELTKGSIEDLNLLWEIYYPKILKLCSRLSFYKNFDKDELLGESYIYFVEFCKRYNPYYNCGFYPFDNYIFYNLIMKLKAYIQKYYFKTKREPASEFSEFLSQETQNNVIESDQKQYVEYIYSLLNDREKTILDLISQGYRQDEIGKMLGITQSRCSIIRKRALEKLQGILVEKELRESKGLKVINMVKKSKPYKEKVRVTDEMLNDARNFRYEEWYFKYHLSRPFYTKIRKKNYKIE